MGLSLLWYESPMMVNKKSYFFAAILASISDANLEFYPIFKMELRAKYQAPREGGSAGAPHQGRKSLGVRENQSSKL